MTFSLAACAIGALLSLWTEAAVMGDVAWPDAGPAFSEMLASTHYGHAGLTAVVLLVLAMLVHWRLKRKGAEMRSIHVVAGLVLLVAAARVSIGHASEHGLFSVAAWIEWLHVLLMSLWAGTVFVAGWIVLPQVLVDESSPTGQRAAYLSALSNWATAALAGILATGAYNTYRVLDSPRDLIEGDYGHVLVFKLGFVLVAIALGGFNRFHGLPAAMSVQPEKARRGLRGVIAVLRIEGGEGVCGYLCMGSADPDRFAAGMATDLLQRFAVFVSAGLVNVAHRQRLRQEGVTDPLTGLPNRRYFDARLREEVQRAARVAAPVACLFVDIDSFKHINDTYGHGVGDRALVAVGACIRRSVRLGETVARYGGEEFVALVQGDARQASVVAERVRASVEGLTVLDDRGTPTPVAWTRLRAPQASMAAAPDATVLAAVAASPLSATYGTPVDRESAYEMLSAKAAQSAAFSPVPR